MPIWNELPLHQKIKYFVEIIAILGGLFLIGINTYQIKLLKESNSINFLNLKASFPLDIEIGIVGYEDNIPLVLRLNITNVGRNRITLDPLSPKLFLPDSEIIEDGFESVDTTIYKQHKPTLFREHEIALNTLENCVLEVVANINILGYSEEYENFISTYILLPIMVKGAVYSEDKTLLIKLSRNKNKSLIISSEVIRITDHEILSKILRIERSQIELPLWE